jgi:phosphoribosylanthranilate isomerase
MRVKICGITKIEDGELALRLGADELGFVLAPSSRRVSPEAAKAIVDALRGIGDLQDFRAIGVFVNEAPGAMRDIIAFAGLDAAQLHGDESPEDCEAFEFPWYRALRVGSVADAMALVPRQWGCHRLLVDASSAAAYGGTGSSVGTWAALASRAMARESGKEFFLAGGVRPRNVASFIYSFSPDGIDVSSGVEERPGVKSADKLGALFAAIGRARSEEEEYSRAAR